MKYLPIIDNCLATKVHGKRDILSRLLPRHGFHPFGQTWSIIMKKIATARSMTMRRWMCNKLFPRQINYTMVRWSDATGARVCVHFFPFPTNLCKNAFPVSLSRPDSPSFYYYCARYNTTGFHTARQQFALDCLPHCWTNVLRPSTGRRKTVLWNDHFKWHFFTLPKSRFTAVRKL